MVLKFLASDFFSSLYFLAAKFLSAGAMYMLLPEGVGSQMTVVEVRELVRVCGMVRTVCPSGHSKIKEPLLYVIHTCFSCICHAALRISQTTYVILRKKEEKNKQRKKGEEQDSTPRRVPLHARPRTTGRGFLLVLYFE
ncbi:unnamed protein product [Ectocarpus sp. 12 AP-2014]